MDIQRDPYPINPLFTISAIYNLRNASLDRSFDVFRLDSDIALAHRSVDDNIQRANKRSSTMIAPYVGGRSSGRTVSRTRHAKGQVGIGVYLVRTVQSDRVLARPTPLR
jgi:hypothetical protein